MHSCSTNYSRPGYQKSSNEDNTQSRIVKMLKIIILHIMLKLSSFISEKKGSHRNNL